MHKPLAFAFALALLHAAPAAFAQEACPSRTDLPPTVNLRIDNDLFGNQDQGYTSGVQLSFVSPNLADYTDDPCLPRPARWLNGYLSALQPEGFDQQNMVVTLAQGIFTPTDFTRSDLIEDDRPYAAMLLMGIGYNARKGDSLRHTQLQFGILGESALGEDVQDWVHKQTDDEPFEGWDNQLRDEPVFRVVHERMRRFSPGSERTWGWDAITHWGGSVGTIATYANVGAELRFGRHLPDDFGSTPLRPAGENTAPTRGPRAGGPFGIHVFITADGRGVLRDITLDGNTWKDSHSVDKRPWVADLGYGLVMSKGRWKFAFARYERTREFEEQVEHPEYGSVTVSRTF